MSKESQSNMWVIQTTIWPPRQREKLTALHINEKRQGQQYAYGDTDRSRGKIFLMNTSILVYESQN